MMITWEDRKLKGKVDDETILIKPSFSFNYAWFLLNDKTAQFVTTHDEGTYNEFMTPEQVTEVTAFYDNCATPVAVVVPLTLDETKVAKKLEAKQHRINVTEAPIDGVQVATLEDRENLAGAIDFFGILSGDNNFIIWIPANNIPIQVTKDQLIAIRNSYITGKNGAFAVYIAKCAEIDACTTIAELELVKVV